ncbi:hypothetical protein HPULCUR_008852 [Helicostylum pulchrum]|uniref:Uncharacterized protein n=1 Tax=Helicostylum pulchrum TaxID=562976 RepID=A0ABP9Y926_9FUNG
MASKDVLDQIRDLQTFIDDFVADAGSPTSVSPPSTPQEKTELILPAPVTKDTVFHKPDDVQVHKPDEVQEFEPKKTVEEKTAKEEPEEKTLVEQPLSMLSYDLNLSADFSSLLTQFNEIKVSPVEVKQPQPQNIYSDDDKEKIQLDPITIDNYTTGTPKFSDSFFLNEHTPSSGVSTKSQSRRTSISSKKSQRSARSSRRQNEKKLQYKQQQQQLQQQQPQKYVERSYDEMMRIPDIYERLAFYEKTLDLCLKAESPIASWHTSNKEKGKPQPMLEGYVPPVRLLSPEVPLSESGFGNMSSTLSGSISMFLKKAGGSHSVPKRPDTKSLLASSSNYNTPYTSNNNYHTGSGLFGKSMSRLNLSRSTQVPRYDHQLQPINTPVATRSMYNKQISSPRKTKSSANNELSPLCINYGHDRGSSLIRTPRSSSSTPSSFGSTTTINSQGEFTSRSSGLNYMINILPQVDISILQRALDEAKGDPMVAISIAVSLNKLSTNNNNHSPMQTTKRYHNKRIK